MANCKPLKSPCDRGIGKEPDNFPSVTDPRLYREMVGSLMYAMTATRPDLSYIVTIKPFTENGKVYSGICKVPLIALQYS